jgi:microcystin degradation protein MlrC
LTRIGIAGIAIESSTFSPHRTTVDDFRITRGDDLLARYAFLDDDIEWVPLLHAVSLPGGAVTEETYAALSEEIYARLRSCGPLDGLFFDIHGAMSVLGRVDVEADLIEGIRAIIGPDVLVSASMDLHGNVSHRLARALDLITCYRKAPHTDAWDTRERAVRNLVKRLRHGGKPLRPGCGCRCCCRGRRPAPASSRLRASTPWSTKSRPCLESWTPRSGSATPGPTNPVARPRLSSPATTAT